MSSLTEIIRANLPFLAENTTNLSVLYNFTIQEQILTLYDVEYIKSKPTSYEKSTDFFLLISKKDVTLEKLVSILRDTGNAHLAEVLTRNIFENPVKIQDEEKPVEGNDSSNLISKDLTSLAPAATANFKDPLMLDKLTPNSDNSYLRCIWFRVGSKIENFDPSTHENFENNYEILKERYHQCNLRKSCNPEIIIIEGSRGVGKSELVRYFTEEIVRKEKGHCIWIDSNTESDTLTFLLELGQPNWLDFKVEDVNFNLILRTIFAKLRSKRKPKLIVFDDISSTNSVLESLKSLTDIQDNVLIVLTTLDNRVKLRFEICTHIPVTEFDSRDSASFLRIVLQLTNRKEERKAEEISELVDHNPGILKKVIALFNSVIHNTDGVTKLQALEVCKTKFQAKNKNDSTDEHENVDGVVDVQRNSVEAGFGAFGKVYKRQFMTTITVAEKEIDFKGMSKTEISKAQNEVILWRNLSHKNILKFIHDEYNEEVDKMIIRMEWCPLKDLCRWLNQTNTGNAQNLKDGKYFFQGIMEGLKHIHERGLIHRDIKPDNILLVNTKGGKIIAKIGDFGLMRKLDARKPLSNQSGTYVYASPEMRDYLNYGNLTDVWSAGMVLFEILFYNMNRNRDNNEYFDKQLQFYRDYSFPRELDVYPEEKRIIMAMMADQKSRFSAESVLAEINKLWWADK